MSKEGYNPLDLRAYRGIAGRSWRHGKEERDAIPSRLWQDVWARVFLPTPDFLDRISQKGVELVWPQRLRKAIPHMTVRGWYREEEADALLEDWGIATKLPTVIDQAAMQRFLDTEPGNWHDHIIGYGVLGSGMDDTHLVVRFPPNATQLIDRADKLLRSPEIETPNHFKMGDISVQIDLSRASSVQLEQPLEHIEMPFKSEESPTKHTIRFDLRTWTP